MVTGLYTTASMIISSVWLSEAFLEIPTGVFSDLLGRKKTIVLGTLLSVAAYAFYAGYAGYWMLFLGSFFEGGSRALFSGNNNAYLHNLLRAEHEEGDYHHYYGRLNAVMGVAMFAAALGSGVLVGWSVHFFMWIDLGPQLAALGLSLALVDVPKDGAKVSVAGHLRETFNEIRGNLSLRYLSLSQMLGGGGLASYEFQAAVYAAVWPTWAIGVARAIQEGGVIPSFYFAGNIIDRLGYVKVMAANTITGTLGVILASVARSVFSPVFIMLSLPLYGAGDTASQHLLQKEFTERQRATIASLNSFGNSLTFAVSLYVCGLIANAYGPFAALLATQAFLIPSDYFEAKFLWRLRGLNH